MHFSPETGPRKAKLYDEPRTMEVNSPAPFEYIQVLSPPGHLGYLGAAFLMQEEEEGLPLRSLSPPTKSPLRSCGGEHDHQWQHGTFPRHIETLKYLRAMTWKDLFPVRSSAHPLPSFLTSRDGFRQSTTTYTSYLLLILFVSPLSVS